MEEKRKVAVIGAGSAGITTAKSLVEEGFSVTIFERSADIGGQWNYNGVNSGVWDTLHANTSKKITSFSDFPLDEKLPHFVHHQQMKEYFRKYMIHFGFSDRVMLNHEVEHSERRKEDGKWRLTIRNIRTDKVKTEDFDFLVVATGRYSIPSRLNIDWSPFLKAGGTVLPSQQYRSPMLFANKKVLVVGGSFSGVDIALDLLSTAAHVVHSVRSSYWIIEKRVGTKIYDEAFWRRSALDVPPELYIPAVVNILKSIDANPGKHGGVPASEKLFTETSLCIGPGFNDALLDGRLSQRPNIKTVNSDGSITFEDGHKETFDVVIEATGYRISFPFLPKELACEILDDSANYVKLFHWTFHPSISNLAVVGQYKSLAAYNPQFELQGRWISYVWKGLRKLPSQEEMKKWISGTLTPFESSRFPIRAHHTIMEDFAELAGVVPSPEKNPDIKNLLKDGLLLGALYRLDGPGAKKKEATDLIIKWNKEHTAY
jgi:hypothetical protein